MEFGSKGDELKCWRSRPTASAVPQGFVTFFPLRILDDARLPGFGRERGSSVLRDDLAEDVRQNPAVLIVIDFDRRIDAAADRDVFNPAVLARDAKAHVLLRF